MPGVDVRLVDDDGNVIPTGTTDALGEVEVRGASLFHGYLDRPDATARAHHDGWFRTGDTAVRDADGFYTIVGRTALDVIKTGGFKVGAGEVEDALRLHPDVAEVAVTGESDDDLGQRIAAWVVLHPGCACDAVDDPDACRRPALLAQTPAHRPLPRCAPAQRHGQGREAQTHAAARIAPHGAINFATVSISRSPRKFAATIRPSASNTYVVGSDITLNCCASSPL